VSVKCTNPLAKKSISSFVACTTTLLNMSRGIKSNVMDDVPSSADLFALASTFLVVFEVALVLHATHIIVLKIDLQFAHVLAK
jgi:hypothetical protein